MKRALLAIVSTVAALVMLLSFKTQPQSVSATPPAAVSSSGGSAETSSSSSGDSSSSNTAKTYVGAAAQTRYGPVQVQITVENGKLTDVNAVEYPHDNSRDEQINAYAIPALNQEARQMGNGNIDMISGATYTSRGYMSSLQSALDQAGL